jgi:Fur family iron response transcriptional regulator
MIFTSTVEAADRPSGPVVRAELTGCPWHDTKTMLRQVGLRPTRQRMALGWILFAKGDRHITAEMLYEEASRAKVPVSLATVYNTLRAFCQAGLMHEVTVDGTRSYFDTRTDEHPHYYWEEDGRLTDAPNDAVVLSGAPRLPEGAELDRIDVVIRLRRKR